MSSASANETPVIERPIAPGEAGFGPPTPKNAVAFAAPIVSSVAVPVEPFSSRTLVEVPFSNAKSPLT